MDKTKFYFVYVPPKSNSHGHGVRAKRVISGVQTTVNAITKHLAALPDKELSVTVQYDKYNPEELIQANTTIDKLNEFLGVSKSKFDDQVYLYDKSIVRWENHSKTIFDILYYIEDQDKQQKLLPLSAFWICNFYSYGDNESPNGSFMLSIEDGRQFVRIHMILPFTTDDERAYDLIEQLNNDLPFNLSNKNFRILGVKNKRYSQFKLDEELQKRIDLCLKK